MRRMHRVGYPLSLRSCRQLTVLADGIVHEHVENEEFADITDFNLRSFRYPV